MTTVSIQDAAAQLDVTERTVRNWIAAGRLRAYRLGPRLIRVDVESIADLHRPLSA